MNPWIEKSIELANTENYLDRLHQVYPVQQEGRRPLPPELKTELAAIYHSGNDLALVKRLLGLRKKFRFPIKDPYVAFLGKNPKFCELNPSTIARVAQTIRSLGFEGMIASLEEPIEFNRQIGTLFKKWISQIGYPLLPEEDFQTASGIAFLQGSNGELKNVANEKLGCQLQKGPDFVAKVQKASSTQYIIGETKFITEFGGHQNAQFEDAMRLLADNTGNAERIAILDGVVWIRDSTKMYRRVCNLAKPAFSALLLKEFLEESLKSLT